MKRAFGVLFMLLGVVAIAIGAWQCVAWIWRGVTEPYMIPFVVMGFSFWFFISAAGALFIWDGIKLFWRR